MGTYCSFPFLGVIITLITHILRATKSPAFFKVVGVQRFVLEHHHFYKKICFLRIFGGVLNWPCPKNPRISMAGFGSLHHFFPTEKKEQREPNPVDIPLNPDWLMTGFLFHGL